MARHTGKPIAGALLFSNMFVTCQQMAVASASWLLALIIATAIIIHIMEGQGWIGSCGPQGWCSIAQRAAWRADGANLTSGARVLLWPSETNVYIILSPHSTEFNPVRAGAQPSLLLDLGRQAAGVQATGVRTMPVFRGDVVPSGIKKPRARTGRNVCVGWGNGTRKRTRTAPHVLLRAHVRFVDARPARRRMRMLHASAISTPVTPTGHGPRPGGPDNGTAVCHASAPVSGFVRASATDAAGKKLTSRGARFWSGACDCEWQWPMGKRRHAMAHE